MKIHMRTTDEMCTPEKLARNLDACVLAIPAVRSSNPLLVKQFMMWIQVPPPL